VAVEGTVAAEVDKLDSGTIEEDTPGHNSAESMRVLKEKLSTVEPG
jgi:hypothetical protein